MEMEEPKKMPEDILNLEIEYLSQNVRPYITKVVDSWGSYMKKTKDSIPPNHIIVNIQMLLWQLRPVGRLTLHELEGFESRNKILQKILRSKERANFDQDIIKFINDITDKIGDCKMFARPGDEGASGGFAKLWADVDEEEKKGEAVESDGS